VDKQCTILYAGCGTGGLTEALQAYEQNGGFLDLIIPLLFEPSPSH
jgi:hypothetical protein